MRGLLVGGKGQNATGRAQLSSFTDSWFGISGSQRRYIGVMMLTLTPRYVRGHDMCMYIGPPVFLMVDTPTLFLGFALMFVFKISCCLLS